MELAMDRVDIEKQVARLKPRVAPRRNGRAIKVHAGALDMNFYLEKPFGRPLSDALWARLAQCGITSGWKKGAELYPSDVNLFKLKLMLDNSQSDFCN
jgi:hypothetical protein